MTNFFQNPVNQKIQNPEPAGYGAARSALLQRYFQQMQNPYGLSGTQPPPPQGSVPYSPYPQGMSQHGGMGLGRRSPQGGPQGGPPSGVAGIPDQMQGMAPQGGGQGGQQVQAPGGSAPGANSGSAGGSSDALMQQMQKMMATQGKGFGGQTAQVTPNQQAPSPGGQVMGPGGAAPQDPYAGVGESAYNIWKSQGSPGGAGGGQSNPGMNMPSQGGAPSKDQPGMPPIGDTGDATPSGDDPGSKMPSYLMQAKNRGEAAYNQNPGQYDGFHANRFMPIHAPRQASASGNPSVNSMVSGAQGSARYGQRVANRTASGHSGQVYDGAPQGAPPGVPQGGIGPTPNYSGFDPSMIQAIQGAQTGRAQQSATDRGYQYAGSGVVPYQGGAGQGFQANGGAPMPGGGGVTPQAATGTSYGGPSQGGAPQYDGGMGAPGGSAGLNMGGYDGRQGSVELMKHHGKMLQSILPHLLASSQQAHMGGGMGQPQAAPPGPMGAGMGNPRPQPGGMGRPGLPNMFGR